MKYVVALIPVALALVGFIPTIGFLYLWKRKERQELTKSPLTRNLLRPPGHSLRCKFREVYDEIQLSIVILVMIPLIVFAIHVSQSYFAGEPESVLRIVISVGLGIGTTGVIGWQLLPRLTQLKNLGLGLEGELATGEELNQLMLDGCRVFHDIPFPYGNIDHVVVSQSGVFSVNTKMHSKPKGGDGNAQITVDQQQSVVKFPDHDYRIDLKQFQTESDWLKKHLSSAVGQPINVEPILALPGWFIEERIGRGLVYVINPHKPKKFFLNSRQVLSPAVVQQVAHQLEQLVRDVEPSFQEKRERWEDTK